jgi:hypothetical protein
MSQPPSLQTVATLTGGTSPVMQQAFFWGIPGRPFSVGTHGDWVVNAPGVEPLHFFLNFDGRMIQVASGPTGANVTVGGVPIDHLWRPVPVFAEIAFGGARMRVTCEEAPEEDSLPPAPVAAAAIPAAPVLPAKVSTAPVPAVPVLPAAMSAAPVPTVTLPTSAVPTPPLQPNPAAFHGSPAHTPQAPDRASYQRPNQLTTQPLAFTPEQRAYANAPAPTLSIRDSAAPAPYEPGQSGSFAPVGASANQAPPGVVPTLHSMASPSSGGRTNSSAPPPVIIPAGRPFVPVPTAATVALPPVHLEQHDDAGAISTVSDAGALRALADRVQNDPTISKAAEAYFAEVQRTASGQVPAAGAPPPGGRHPSAAPSEFGVGGTRIMQGAPPARDSAVDEPLAGSKPEKQKTSWVMRVVMVLLPIAGYFAIFWEPPADAPAPADDSSASTDTSASPTASATARASASAPAPELASAAPASTPSANVAPPGASGAPLARSASTPVVAPAAPASAAAASAPTNALPPSTRQARDALTAAFEGKLEEAVQRYEKLAAGPDGETYRVTARLIRERAVRKP